MRGAQNGPPDFFNTDWMVTDTYSCILDAGRVRIAELTRQEFYSGRNDKTPGTVKERASANEKSSTKDDAAQNAADAEAITRILQDLEMSASRSRRQP